MLLDHAMPLGPAFRALAGLDQIASTSYRLEDLHITFDFEQEEFLQHGWKD
ncbi:MAG: hypothetical protein IMW89_20170 [Ktedonobacteraceae bacterium]|nr:hypothetical protein [Ktedonobacteraceae bacterium]